MAATETKDYGDSFKMASAYLDGLEKLGKVVPGSRVAILDRLKDTHGGRADVLKATVKYVHGSTHPLTQEHEPGRGGVYLDPSGPKADLPIRDMIAALVAGGYVVKSQSDYLFRVEAAAMAGQDLAGVADRLGRKLLDRSSNVFLQAPIPPPRNVQMVRECLEVFKDVIPGGASNREELAEKLGHLGNQYSGGRLYRQVASQLEDRGDLIDGFKFDPRDGIFLDKPLSGELADQARAMRL